MTNKVIGGIQNMKKVIFILTVAIIFFMNPLIGYGNGASSGTNDEYTVIPDDSIRLRILAHSNSEQDQEIKRAIRDRVNAEITDWVLKLNNIETARDVISNNLIDLEKIVQDVLDEYKVNQTFDIQFGEVEFPSKLYGDVVYPAGVYEAVLITLGDGQGDNWWCVLFPPLCFLDFSNGTAVASADDATLAKEAGKEKVEVKFFLFEWIEKLINLLFK